MDWSFVEAEHRAWVRFVAALDLSPEHSMRLIRGRFRMFRARRPQDR